MSLFGIFEDRMKQIFESGNAMAPLPFKKLAKTAVREMKDCSAKVDGRHVAPSLYTILVNPGDDNVIAPLYQKVTDELVDFLAHEAQNAGLSLMANPMVRFIAVPDIKPGKMEVVAEIVSPEVLAQVRAEESDYVRSRCGGMARPAAPAPVEPRPTRPATVAADPFSFIDEDPAKPVLSLEFENQPKPAPAPRATTPGAATCELVQSGNGKVWRIGVETTVIGRDEAVADLVLPDTNISRRHAELKRTPSGWHISDLGSTNGTRVNGLRVTSQDLSSGDTITMGLMTLTFREV